MNNRQRPIDVDAVGREFVLDPAILWLNMAAFSQSRHRNLLSPSQPLSPPDRLPLFARWRLAVDFGLRTLDRFALPRQGKTVSLDAIGIIHRRDVIAGRDHGIGTNDPQPAGSDTALQRSVETMRRVAKLMLLRSPLVLGLEQR